MDKLIEIYTGNTPASIPPDLTVEPEETKPDITQSKTRKSVKSQSRASKDDVIKSDVIHPENTETTIVVQ